MLHRLLDDRDKGFEHDISAAQYQTVAKVSEVTATRHLDDMLEKNCLLRLRGGGRSTRYQSIAWTIEAPRSFAQNPHVC